MITEIATTSLVGGILCLDRVFLQFMVSRPIVAAPLVGFLLGDIYTGLIAGAFVELFWIDRLPIGLYIPPNDTITAILIAASSVEAGRAIGGVTPGLTALSVLAFVPFGHFAQKVDLSVVKGSEKTAAIVLREVSEGRDINLSCRHFSPLLKTFLFSTGFIMLALFAGIPFLAALYSALPAWATDGLDRLYPMLPLIGTTVALRSVHVRGALPIFCGLFLSGCAVLWHIRTNG
jgi:PTS system mannose-specific IIC component